LDEFCRFFSGKTIIEKKTIWRKTMTFNYKNKVEFKINHVDNRLEAYLAPDTPEGEGGKFAKVCDIISSGFPMPCSGTVINMTAAINYIANSITEIPFSVTATNYQSGGLYDFEIWVDDQKVHHEKDSLKKWNAQQFIYMFKKV
jgi:hypothetical protein